MRSATRIVVALSLAGVVLVAVATTAFAQSIEGGCVARVNGRTPESMTEDDPLLLDKEDRVRVRGQAPAGAQPGATETTVKVIVFGLSVPVETTEGQGTQWGGTGELPSYLKTLAPGVYRAEADGSGPGWSCDASGYIEIDGGPISVAAGVGAVLAGLGLAMSLGSRGGSSNVPDRGLVARKTGIDDREAIIRPDRGRTSAADLAYLVILALFFWLCLEEMIDFGESIGFAAPAAAAAAAGTHRMWVRGRVVRGFFGGLFLGLGAALLLHQFDVWVLDLTQGLIFPLGVAVITALRAWVGSAYVVTPPAAAVREPDPEPAPVGGGTTTASEV
jgi:hypothetical protein